MRVLIGLAAIMLAAAPASAQLSAQGGRIQVVSDRGEVLERENKAIYSGNVDVIQGDARLTADQITVNFTGAAGDEGGIGSGLGDIRNIVAEGDVYYVTPDLRARGDKGTYDANADSITLEGGVVVQRGEDVAEGDQLVLSISEGRTVLGGGGGRQRTVFTPPQGDESEQTP